MSSQAQFDDEFFKIAAGLDLKEPKYVPGRYTWLPSMAVVVATLATVLLGTILGGFMTVVAVVAFAAGVLLAAKLWPTHAKAARTRKRRQQVDYDLSRDEN